MPVIPALRRLRRDECFEFKFSLRDMVLKREREKKKAIKNKVGLLPSVLNISVVCAYVCSFL